MYLSSKHNFLKLKIYSIPLSIVIASLLLIAVGMVLLYSADASNIKAYGDAGTLSFTKLLFFYQESWFYKQLFTFIAFTPIVFLVSILNTRQIYRHVEYIYAATILLLLLAHYFGHTAMGAQRWLRIGSINIQPVEFAKLGIILMLAKHYNKTHIDRLKNPQNLLYPGFIILLPATIVFMQPNLGSALIIIAIGIALMFCAGVALRLFVYTFICGLIWCPIMWHWFLKPYQKQRIMTFINPDEDRLGSGYNILQSKIAIGSGSVFGKGFMKGTQTQLNFLPEKQTDFIFTILAEEFGLIGCSLLLIIYLYLIFSAYRIANATHHHFGRLVVFGVSTMLFMHIIINLSMISGLIPVAGIPLPFLSYGRSNLIVMMLGCALIMNVAVHKNLKIGK